MLSEKCETVVAELKQVDQKYSKKLTQMQEQHELVRGEGRWAAGRGDGMWQGRPSSVVLHLREAQLLAVGSEAQGFALTKSLCCLKLGAWDRLSGGTNPVPQKDVYL